MRFALTYYDADDILKKALKDTDTNLGALLAASSIWASPKVHEYLVSENGSGAWRPNVRRAKPGETRRTKVDGILLDDNTCANTYIKAAIGVQKNMIVGFETCHIWPSSCYDPSHHTTIANLVLVPRSIASLSDHSEDVSSVLKYRSFELYGWYPKGKKKPNKPKRYPGNWLLPFEFTEKIQMSLKKRNWAKKI